MTAGDRPAFLEVFTRLVAALLGSPPDLLVMRTYFEALLDVDIEFVLAAGDRLLRTATFFPKVSEWRQMASQIERERIEAQRARLRRLAEPLCALCADTGWVVDGNRATRCECVGQRRLEVLGRAQAPRLEA